MDLVVMEGTSAPGARTGGIQAELLYCLQGLFSNQFGEEPERLSYTYSYTYNCEARRQGRKQSAAILQGAGTQQTILAPQVGRQEGLCTVTT